MNPQRTLFCFYINHWHKIKPLHWGPNTRSIIRSTEITTEAVSFIHDTLIVILPSLVQYLPGWIITDTDCNHFCFLLWLPQEFVAATSAPAHPGQTDGQTDRGGPVVSTSSSACSHSPTTAFCEVTKCQLHQSAPVPRAALLHQHGSHVFNSHLRHGAESVLPLPAPQSRPRTTGVACWVWFMCKGKSKSLKSKKYK